MYLLAGILLALNATPCPAGIPWAMHVIDDSLTGADGVKLKDINGDGYPDLASGFEEGGEVRVFFHPKFHRVRQPWPRVTVGRMNGPEDAVFVDVDGNGIQDVISCAQSKLAEPTNAVFVHRAPATPDRYLDETAWRSEAIPASLGRSWMFCEPLADGDALRLFCGSKNLNASIGYFTVNGPSVVDWTWHHLRDASWVMSLDIVDMDGDGDRDVLYSDRRGLTAAVGWLENPGRLEPTWIDHLIETLPGKPDPMGRFMFLDQADVDGDGLTDVVAAVRRHQVHWLRRLDLWGEQWELNVITMPPEAGCVKAVAAGDLDGTGSVELVVSCEQAEGRPGLLRLTWNGLSWTARDIGGPAGSKFDLVQLVDLDGDGDLDVLTTEEREIDAVIWYENPGSGPAGD